MKLDRTTVCQLFNIKKPVWGGRKVGLNIDRIGDHNEVNILATNKDGERLYPHSLYISGEKAKGYPVQKLNNYPVTLRIIPIDDLERLERV